MILVLDNYDSFTFNLVQYLGEVTDARRRILVRRNDEVTVDELRSLVPSHLVISPGPCTPNEAGISMDAVRAFAGVIPILGVCLGHQAIAQAFGGTIVRASAVVHGKTSLIEHDGTGIFADIEQRFTATRYHSLVASPDDFPACLKATAWTEGSTDAKASSRREIMALVHKNHPDVIGVQFHPESILTKVGKQLLSNFLKLGKPSPKGETA